MVQYNNSFEVEFSFYNNQREAVNDVNEAAIMAADFDCVHCGASLILSKPYDSVPLHYESLLAICDSIQCGICDTSYHHYQSEGIDFVRYQKKAIIEMATVNVIPIEVITEIYEAYFDHYYGKVQTLGNWPNDIFDANKQLNRSAMNLIKLPELSDENFHQQYDAVLNMAIHSINCLDFLNKYKYQHSMKFEIFKSKSGEEFYFRLKSANGQSLIGSEGYTSKAACKNGIESVKKNSQREAAFQKKESANGKYYFNLLAANHQVIARSQMYQSKQGLENCIAAVQKSAPISEWIDLTIEDNE